MWVCPVQVASRVAALTFNPSLNRSMQFQDYTYDLVRALHRFLLLRWLAPGMGNATHSVLPGQNATMHSPTVHVWSPSRGRPHTCPHRLAAGSLLAVIKSCTSNSMWKSSFN